MAQLVKNLPGEAISGPQGHLDAMSQDRACSLEALKPELPLPAAASAAAELRFQGDSTKPEIKP